MPTTLQVSHCIDRYVHQRTELPLQTNSDAHRTQNWRTCTHTHARTCARLFGPRSMKLQRPFPQSTAASSARSPEICDNISPARPNPNGPQPVAWPHAFACEPMPTARRRGGARNGHHRLGGSSYKPLDSYYFT